MEKVKQAITAARAEGGRRAANVMIWKCAGLARSVALAPTKKMSWAGMPKKIERKKPQHGLVEVAGRRRNPYRFNLVTLTLIAAVARSGSISAGAKALNMAIAAASKRLADFEDECGVAIFVRHRDGVTVSQEGPPIIRRIEALLIEVENLALDVSEQSSGAVGQVRIWVNSGAMDLSFPEDIAAFMRSNPSVRVDLQEASSAEIMRAVTAGQADIGVFADTHKAHELQAYVYQIEELVLVTPKAHALADLRQTTLKAALDYDFVGPLQGTPLDSRVIASMHLLRRVKKTRLQVRGAERICRMIAAGIGIGILPRAAAQRHLARLDLRAVRLDEAWARRNLLLGVRDMGSLQPAARMLVSHLCPDLR